MKRQYRSNQGRSPKRMEKNYKLVLFSLIGLLITFIFIILSQ
jgi:hypothetical protein